MAKAILVLDKTPMDCEDCPFSYRNAVTGVKCSVTNKTIGETWSDVSEGKRFWDCPLKELPEEKNVISITVLGEEAEQNGFSTQRQAGFNAGYNACLKDITEDD